MNDVPNRHEPATLKECKLVLGVLNARKSSLESRVSAKVTLDGDRAHYQQLLEETTQEITQYQAMLQKWRQELIDRAPYRITQADDPYDLLMGAYRALESLELPKDDEERGWMREIRNMVKDYLSSHRPSLVASLPENESLIMPAEVQDFCLIVGRALESGGYDGMNLIAIGQTTKLRSLNADCQALRSYFVSGLNHILRCRSKKLCPKSEE